MDLVAVPLTAAGATLHADEPRRERGQGLLQGLSRGGKGSVAVGPPVARGDRPGWLSGGRLAWLRLSDDDGLRSLLGQLVVLVGQLLQTLPGLVVGHLSRQHAYVLGLLTVSGWFVH